MRFSAISSRVKSCVSSSTLDGSLDIMVGREDVIGAESAVDVVRAYVELWRKILPNPRKEVGELGMEEAFSDSARSLSTTALRRYAIATRQAVSSLGSRYQMSRWLHTIGGMHDIVEIVNGQAAIRIDLSCNPRLPILACSSRLVSSSSWK
jgi:hypothetical protein